jgi:hypothetical protein
LSAAPKTSWAWMHVRNVGSRVRPRTRSLKPLRLWTLRVALRRMRRWGRSPRSRRSRLAEGSLMPRASDAGYSNGAAGEKVSYYNPSTEEIAFNAETEEEQLGLATARSAEADIQEDREDYVSPGTSSSTSGSRPDKSGTSSMTDPRSPARTTDSPYSKDQPQNPESSSAHSTDGSGQETTSGQQSQQDSSADSAPAGAAATLRVTKGSKRGSAS